MNNSIFFAHTIFDVKIISEYKRQLKKNIPILTISSDAYNYAKEIGFEEILFLEYLEEEINDDEFYYSDILARDLDFGESELRKDILEFNQDSLGWNYLNYFFIFWGLLRINKAFKEIITKIQFFDAIYVVNTGNQPSFHFDSYLNKRLMLNFLAERCNKIIMISGVFSERLNSLREIRKKINNKISIHKNITHIPTCFYESNRFYENYDLDINNCIDIESLNWDVKINSNRINLLQDDKFNSRFFYPMEYFSAYSQILDESFRKITKRIDCSFEVNKEYFLEKTKFHLNLKNDIENFGLFDGVKNLYVTEHDAGMQGPLMYTANERGVTINVIPHSRIQNIPIPFYSCLIRHEVYTKSNHINLSKKENKIQNINLNSIKKYSNKIKVKKILFVFNDEDDAFGIPYTNLKKFDLYFNNFLNQLTEKNITLGIRFKPGKFSSIQINNKFVNCSGNKGDLIEWADICVSLFSPTTFMHDFQLNGKRCFHLQEKKLNELEEVLLKDNLIVLTSKGYNYLFEDLINLLGI